jgi:hypothetical protein
MASTPRIASEVGHARLYHYEKFRREWLTTTLRDQKIYVTDPAELNDPWDLKPTYDPACLQKPEDVEEFIVWLRSVANPRPDPLTEARFENRVRVDSAFREKFVEGFSSHNYSMFGRRRIYCLTPNPCSSLMWSHYGEGHRGICLEFQLDNPVFKGAWEVSYAEGYPKWAPHKALDYAMDMILTKSDEWAYEKEFRIIASNTYPDGHPLKLDGDFLKLPPGALTGVIVGCLGDYAEVAKLANEYAPGLPVKRIIQIPYHYRLGIEGQAEATAT